MENTEKMQELQKALKGHDWYYHYSDSMRVNDSGERSLKNIMKMVNELGQDGKDLYNQAAPEQFKIK